MASPTVDFWADFMPDTVTIEPWTGNAVSGTPTYGASASYQCRIQMKNHRIIDNLGREIMARGKVFLNSTTVIDTRSKITLPSDFSPINPPILAVNLVSDENGPHHITIEIG